MDLNVTDNSSLFQYEELTCSGADDSQLNWYHHFSWWVEGFLQLATGLLGFLANCLVIPVLCTKKMSNTFNRLLVMLAIFDNVYVMCSMLEAVRNHFVSTDQHLILFIYSLYQIQSMAFICSVYTTVLLAIQRYLAISKPLEYYVEGVAATAGGSTWKIVSMYMVPIIIFSALFNVPKFFEFRIIDEKLMAHDPVSNATVKLNHTRVGFQPTNLRLDEDYVFYYVNLGRLFVIGLLPLLALSLLNGAIYRGIKKRQETILMVQSHRRISSTSQGQGLGLCSTVEELVLFAIVFIFLICSIPRVVLNAYELWNIRTIRENLHNDCFRPPLWVMVTTSLVSYLNTLNCSINFVVYCIMCSAFRQALTNSLNIIRDKVGHSCQKFDCCPTVWKDQSNENSEPLWHWQRSRGQNGMEDEIRVTMQAARPSSNNNRNTKS